MLFLYLHIIIHKYRHGASNFFTTTLKKITGNLRKMHMYVFLEILCIILKIFKIALGVRRTRKII